MPRAPHITKSASGNRLWGCLDDRNEWYSHVFVIQCLPEPIEYALFGLTARVVREWVEPCASQSVTPTLAELGFGFLVYS